MPSIIKASQYDDVKNQGIATGNPTDPIKKTRITLESEARDQHQAIVNDAFQKAKNIVEAAQNYSLNQLKESTMRMNEECAQMKIRSYEDGYSEGLAKGKEEGRDLGYEEGYQQGLRKAEEETQDASRRTRDELNRILQTAESKKSEVLAAFEEDIGGLALTIAQKIIKKELSTDESAIQSIIQNVLESYRNQEWVKIAVSPNTAELLARADRNIVGALQDVSDNIKIIPTPDMGDGDCKIDLPDRLIDAGVDTQLNEIKSALNL